MSELKKLTRLGSDTKKIAALLQAKAPKGHMLAYINPREAALLKQHGGSGKPHADTGILSFEPETDFGFGGYDLGSTEDIAAADQAGQAPIDVSAAPIDMSGITGQLGAGSYGFQAPPQVTSAGAGLTPVSGFDVAPSVQVPETPRYGLGGGAEALTGVAGAPEARTPAEKPLISKETLARLGLSGGLGLLGQRTAARAGEIGRAGAQEMRQTAAPYQQAGQQLQAQAQRGELTPAAQQSLQAVRAQAAQAAERRGGVGVTQAMQQVEAFRQQLLQQQYDYGLKLSGIGDNIALGAIKTGLQADQYVNQLTNQFYTNMAYIASGMAPAARPGGAA